MTFQELETAILSIELAVGTDHCRYRDAVETGIDPVLGYKLTPIDGLTSDWNRSDELLDAIVQQFASEAIVEFRHCRNGDWKVVAPVLGLTFYQWSHLLTPAGMAEGDVASRLSRIPAAGRQEVGERVRWELVAKEFANY